MNRFKSIIAAGLLAAGCLAGAAPAAAQNRHISAVVVLEDDEPEMMSRRVPIYRRVLHELQNMMVGSGITVYDENIGAVRFMHIDKARRTDVELVGIAKGISREHPLDVVVLFNIVASAQADQVVKGVLYPRIRMPARILDVHTGQFVSSFEVNAPNLPPLPADCDDNCLMESVGNDAKLLAGDLASALTEQLKRFTDAGVGPAARPAAMAPAPGGVPRTGPRAVNCEGFPTQFTIVFQAFKPDEMMAVEQDMRLFSCFIELRPVGTGPTFGKFAYRSSAGAERVSFNLRRMLDYLGLTGQVRFDGANTFEVTKVVTQN